MAFTKKPYRKSYRRRVPTGKAKTALVKTIKAVVKKQAELKTFDTKVTGTQILSNVLSNTASYRCDFATDVPLFDNSSASQDGRIGTEIDVRKLEWAGRFACVASLWPKLSLRFILVRFNSSAGAQPTIGKIVTDAATSGQVYNQSIAPDCPYTILMDKRVALTPTSSGSGGLTNYFNVKLTWKTPKSQKRLVKFSQNNISLDYTAVMSGLLRLYWISDQDLGDIAYTSLQSSWSRVSFIDT